MLKKIFQAKSFFIASFFFIFTQCLKLESFSYLPQQPQKTFFCQRSSAKKNTSFLTYLNAFIIIFFIIFVCLIVYWLIKGKDPKKTKIPIKWENKQKKEDFTNDKAYDFINKNKPANEENNLAIYCNNENVPANELFYQLTLFSNYQKFQNLIFIRVEQNQSINNAIDLIDEPAKNLDDDKKNTKEKLKEKLFFLLSPSLDNQVIIDVLYQNINLFLKRNTNNNDYQLNIDQFAEFFSQYFRYHFFAADIEYKINIPGMMQAAQNYIKVFSDWFSNSVLAAAIGSFLKSIICLFYLRCKENKIDFNIEDSPAAKKNRKIFLNKMKIYDDAYDELKPLTLNENDLFSIDKRIIEKIQQAHKTRFLGFLSDKTKAKYIREIWIDFDDIKKHFDLFKGLYSLLEEVKLAESNNDNDKLNRLKTDGFVDRVYSTNFLSNQTLEKNKPKESKVSSIFKNVVNFFTS